MSYSHWFANNHRHKSFWFGIEVDPAQTPIFLRKKLPPFACDVIRIDSYNYSPQWDVGFNHMFAFRRCVMVHRIVYLILREFVPIIFSLQLTNLCDSLASRLYCVVAESHFLNGLSRAIKSSAFRIYLGHCNPLWFSNFIQPVEIVCIEIQIVWSSSQLKLQN